MSCLHYTFFILACHPYCFKLMMYIKKFHILIAVFYKDYKTIIVAYLVLGRRPPVSNSVQKSLHGPPTENQQR